ncbi:myelin expression factor 2-like [Ischnura elegans]|uniref:myelin expression factor 2-like n=1 Tax=Ischnura elegans TaxID=197161 RepID=UPI001ED86C1A|nr:myelin expression factor 2-like [Ischnura elegans]
MYDNHIVVPAAKLDEELDRLEKEGVISLVTYSEWGTPLVPVMQPDGRLRLCVDYKELKDLFRTEVGEVAYVELFSDDEEKPRGCGIVEFENAESVKKAVEKMHRWELKGRKLVVKEDFDIERDKYGRPMKGGSSGGGGGRGNAGMSGGSSRPRDEPRSSWQAPAPLPGPIGPTSPAIQNKWGNTYGLSPQFLECLGINGPLVSRLFVANLDYKVDEKKLRDVFRLAGKVTNAKINRDKDGKSRGHGVVKFEHPVEAVQAISMLHNQLLYDRKMTVRMDRVNEGDERHQIDWKSVSVRVWHHLARGTPTASQ